ncbi:MAG: septum formation initiator family protein [Mollicutes bacterium]|nr:septum formation initiator family protein [Mollicutes bacterium]
MKRKTRKERKRLIAISVIMILLLSFMCYSNYGNFHTIMNNRKKVSVLNSEYIKLQKENKSLKTEIAKMEDPEYLARYAKEKYLYSSDNEIIIRVE